MNNGEKTVAKEAEKRSVSAPAALFSAAETVMARRRIGNFSEYVRDLIRRDLEASHVEQTHQQKEAA
jgi:metal-responsive CopG/Arc/MetJ family transcriptional regulator